MEQRPDCRTAATPEAPDRDWVRRAVERYERPLLSYVSHLARNVDVAREVVQETFMRLCAEARADVEPRVAQWLFTVARNLASDRWRRERNMALINSTTAEVIVSPEPTPHEAQERNDSVAAVLRALAALPQVQQEVIRLKFQQGLRYKEIAGVLNLSVTNVGFILHSALKTLREDLREDSRRRD